MTEAEKAPKLSFGFPVRNGEDTLERVLDSVLSQTFTDLELVISDNASTDETPNICRRRADRDPRVVFCPQERDIGIVANFNRVFELSRGEYFRWIGADDWVEKTYAEKCVSLLEQHPEAIGVTTYQAFWTSAGEDGTKEYVEYQGHRVDSPHAHERFARCVWFMLGDYRLLDPMYTMHRRSVLERTELVRPMIKGDEMLALELSLLGPYVHVPECLSNRVREPDDDEEEDMTEFLRAPGGPPLSGAPEQFISVMYRMVQRADLTPQQRLHCYRAIFSYYWDHFVSERVDPFRRSVAKRLRRRASA